MAYSKVPSYLVGKNLTLMGVTPQTVAADGTLTSGTTASLLGTISSMGQFEAFEYRGSTRDEEISAGDGGMENYVTIKDTFELDITEIPTANATSILMNAWGDYEYIKIAAQATDPRTSGTAGKILTVIGKRGSITFPMVEGKSAVRLTLKPCGIPPTYVAPS